MGNLWYQITAFPFEIYWKSMKYICSLGSSVGTIAYHCTEALDCPPNNNKTIAPRFMIVYNLPLGQVYNKHKRRSYFLIILLG